MKHRQITPLYRQAVPRLPLEATELERAEVTEVLWVRLVRTPTGNFGIGFLRDQLVHFLGANEETAGLVRPVSVQESARVLRDLIAIELEDGADVESDSVAWEKWLENIV